ncbi:MAG TPA: class II aldolase/adducin family protein [Acidobacteriota bacterium]|nr:class II aldolase/adducin family protein [Acidobacteriota bacterium]
MSQIVGEMIAAARQLVASGLVTGAGGNVSVREAGLMWISPSGFSLEDAREEHYPCVSVESGEVVSGEHRPSSEVLMHLYVYRARPDVNAVFHAHPKMTIALCSAGHDLRPIYADYYVYLGGNVPHVPYVTVTTPELARVVEDELRAPDCYGMVLRNHGTITVGASVKEAAFRTHAMEEQAFIQWHALQVGEPTYLTDEECATLDTLGSEEYRRRLLAEMKSNPSNRA